jgi:hypothetical protein
MDIDVHVVVMPDGESTDGTVQTDVPLEQLRADIAEELGLGSPSDWDIAVMPAGLKTPLSRYKPGNGDTLLLVKKSFSRGSSFKRLR